MKGSAGLKLGIRALTVYLRFDLDDLGALGVVAFLIGVRRLP